VSAEPISPADTILDVYGIALAPAVTERLNVAVSRTLKRAAPLLQWQPCDVDGFGCEDKDVDDAR